MVVSYSAALAARCSAGTRTLQYSSLCYTARQVHIHYSIVLYALLLGRYTYNNERDHVAIVEGLQASARWVLSGTPNISGFAAVKHTVLHYAWYYAIIVPTSPASRR